MAGHVGATRHGAPAGLPASAYTQGQRDLVVDELARLHRAVFPSRSSRRLGIARWIKSAMAVDSFSERSAIVGVRSRRGQRVAARPVGEIGGGRRDHGRGVAPAGSGRATPVARFEQALSLPFASKAVTCTK